MFHVNPRQRIHMKHQALFSSKDKNFVKWYFAPALCLHIKKSMKVSV